MTTRTVARGREAEVENPRPSYVESVLNALALRHDPAICWRGGELSGADLADLVGRTAAALRQQCVRPGEIVAVFTGPNRVEMLVARLAAHLVRAAVVHVGANNPVSDLVRLGDKARLEILAATGARVILADVDSLQQAAILANRRASIEVLLVANGPPRPTALGSKPYQGSGHRSGLAAIDVTSGTTGAPRLVRRSFGAHERLVAHLAAEHRADGPGRFLAVTPISSTTAAIVDATLQRGGSVVLHETFDADAVLDAIAHDEITDIYLAVPHLVDLLEHPRLPTVDLTRLSQVVYSGSATPPHRVAQAVKVFGDAIVQLYGSTELGGICALSADDHLEPALHKTVGSPFPWVQMQVRRPGPSAFTTGPETGAIVETGETGEVWVRSDTVMDGYGCGTDGVTRVNALGWFASGDLGRMDRYGCLELTGRVGGMIKRRGVKLYPATIERALRQHPAVRDAVVKARTDGERTEHLLALVSLEPGHLPSEEELRSHVATVLTVDHAPTEFTFWSGMALNASGQPDYSTLNHKAVPRCLR